MNYSILFIFVYIIPLLKETTSFSLASELRSVVNRQQSIVRKSMPTHEMNKFLLIKKNANEKYRR